MLPEVDYDGAKVVEEDKNDFEDGKYGKSYEDVRKEQLNRSDDDQKDDHEDEESGDNEKDGENSEPTGHEQAPDIDRPGNSNDPGRRN